MEIDHHMEIEIEPWQRFDDEGKVVLNRLSSGQLYNKQWFDPRPHPHKLPQLLSWIETSLRSGDYFTNFSVEIFPNDDFFFRENPNPPPMTVGTNLHFCVHFVYSPLSTLKSWTYSMDALYHRNEELYQLDYAFIRQIAYLIVASIGGERIIYTITQPAHDHAHDHAWDIHDFKNDTMVRFWFDPPEESEIAEARWRIYFKPSLLDYLLESI